MKHTKDMRCDNCFWGRKEDAEYVACHVGPGDFILIDNSHWCSHGRYKDGRPWFVDSITEPESQMDGKETR